MTQNEVPIIELKNINKHFGDLHVLKDISLKVNKGEVVVIIGPSGSGKSTLCRTINSLRKADSWLSCVQKSGWCSRHSTFFPI